MRNFISDGIWDLSGKANERYEGQEIVSATIKFNTDEFNRNLERVRELIGRNAQSYVRTTARRLVRSLAYNCPRAPTNISMSGRLRAGFWPAAVLLGIANIYTPIRNLGEGSADDRTSESKPSFRLTNSVPYLQNLQSMEWVNAAKRYVEMKAAQDLARYAKESWERRELIDDLTAE